MFNPYIIILGLFTVTGIGTTIWGVWILARARRSAGWPGIDGEIISCNKADDADSLLPDIRFAYTLAGKRYEKNIDFPSGTSPTQQLSDSYVQRFPRGKVVRVFYNPADPEEATLEPGVHPGDWMVLGFGLGITVLMIAALLMGG